MRTVALALVALVLPMAAHAADGPGMHVSAALTADELGPCGRNSNGSSLDRITACTDLLKIGRTGAEIYVARAAAYSDAGDRAAAIADLDVAILASPDDAAAYAMRGALYLKDEAFRDGLVDLDRALDLAPGDEEALRTRAFAWDELGNLPAAIADYTALVALSGDDSYRYFRGFAFLKRGETAQAWGYRGRGFVHEQAGEMEAAVADYTQALARDPSDDRAFAGRCRAAAALSGAAPAGCPAALTRAATR
jgi:tetratricopeptide (TPR) repeat protein